MWTCITVLDYLRPTTSTALCYTQLDPVRLGTGAEHLHAALILEIKGYPIDLVASRSTEGLNIDRNGNSLA